MNRSVVFMSLLWRFLWCAVAALTGAMVVAQPGVERLAADAPIRVVVPFTAGGQLDSIARLLAIGLREAGHMQVLVENVPGASGAIGLDRVRKAAPDGRTLLLSPVGTLSISPSLVPNFPVDVDRDFAPVTTVVKMPNLLLAHPAVKAQTAADVVALAKASPGKLAYATPGIGSSLHLAGELFESQTGVDMLHVPYRGAAPAINDVISGHVPLMFSSLGTSLAHIRSGALRAIALTDTERSAVMPGIPTMREQGIDGVVATTGFGLLAPAGTPTGVVDALAAEVAAYFSQPAIAEQLRAQALTVWLLPSLAFRELLRSETAGWARIIKARNIRAE